MTGRDPFPQVPAICTGGQGVWGRQHHQQFLRLLCVTSLLANRDSVAIKKPAAFGLGADTCENFIHDDKSQSQPEP